MIANWLPVSIYNDFGGTVIATTITNSTSQDAASAFIDSSPTNKTTISAGSVDISATAQENLTNVAVAGGVSGENSITGVATPLPPTAVSFTGPRIDVDVPASLMPAQGFAADAYTTNLWPRTGLASSSQIADFAPDNSNAPVRRIP